jgi:hypothetical protein
MARPPQETTAWVASHHLVELPDVRDVVIAGPQTLRILRNGYEPFTAGIISSTRVTPDVLQPLLDTDRSIEIVANVPRESVWTGAAISFATARRVAFGAISDLMRAVSWEDVREYVRPEYSFVERGLSQHHRVTTFDREFDRVYIVHRNGLPSLRFVMLNEYELTADHVRTACDRYGNFDVILLNNPNGRPTETAKEVADGIGVKILMWGQFLGRLNSR